MEQSESLNADVFLSSGGRLILHNVRSIDVCNDNLIIRFDPYPLDVHSDVEYREFRFSNLVFVNLFFSEDK